MKTEDYMTLPYTISMVQDWSGDDCIPVWFVQVKELPGCSTEADTLEEASVMIQEAMRLWIDVALDSGMNVPLPSNNCYKSKFA